ncbi:LOW QUALITY PROTEIN: vomeronasal type-1 receptor 3-like [Sarcophilus harrisii]
MSLDHQPFLQGFLVGFYAPGDRGAVSEKIIILDLVLGIVFFIQTRAGILGNLFLLCHYTMTFFRRSIDSLFFHLALANSIMLISKGVPQTMFGFGLKNFLDHVGCKLNHYIILFSITDFLCVGFMVTGLGYMVLLLQRHHQQVQNIHSSSHLSRRSPEIKATYTILVLVFGHRQIHLFLA